MDTEKDELYLVGDLPYQEWLLKKAKEHLSSVESLTKRSTSIIVNWLSVLRFLTT